MGEHHVRLRKGDLEFEVRGDRDFVEQAVERWASLVFNSPAAREPERGSPAPKPIQVRRNITFQDFLKLKEPENALDKLLTLAYFLEKYEGRPRYDLSELDEAWNNAFPHDAFHPELWHDAVERAYLEEACGKFTLTFSGEAYVQNGLTDRFKPRPYGKGVEQFPPT